MDDLTKELYKSMSGSNRAVAYVVKLYELVQLSDLLTDEDMKYIEKFYKLLKSDKED